MKRFRRVLIYAAALTVVLWVMARLMKPQPPARPPAGEVSVYGAVTRGGKPLTWESDQPRLWVEFHPVNGGDGRFYPAECDTAAGTYRIDGIPTGAYRVSVRLLDPFPSRDRLDGAFDPVRTPLRREITRDGQDIPIDLP